MNDHVSRETIKTNAVKVQAVTQAYAKSTITRRLTDPSFAYVNADHSDIRKTFARVGWTPPSKK